LTQIHDDYAFMNILFKIYVMYVTNEDYTHVINEHMSLTNIMS